VVVVVVMEVVVGVGWGLIKGMQAGLVLVVVHIVRAGLKERRKGAGLKTELRQSIRRALKMETAIAVSE
jgi:hypothetical protein